MRKYISLVALFFLFKLNYASDKIVPASEVIKSGTTLYYRVTANNTSYPFIVKIISMDKNKGITFEYDQQSATPKKARVELTAEALRDAQSMHNLFNGKDAVLNNSISLFLSTKMYNEIYNNQPKDGGQIRSAAIKLDAKDAAPMLFNNNEYKKIYAAKDGLFSTNEIQNEETNYIIRFAEDVKCPLITYMDLGWSIALEKIE